MSQVNYNIKEEKTKNKYITKSERDHIERVYNKYADKIQKKKVKLTIVIKELGEILEKSERTIRREIKKGLVEKLNYDYTTTMIYSAQLAHKKYKINQTAKGPQLKLGNDYELVRYLKRLIIKKKYKVQVAHKKAIEAGYKMNFSWRTLYNYIELGLLGEKRDLVKKYRKKGNSKAKKAKKAINYEKSIENRPKHINDRQEYGHYEMDTVIGTKEKNKVLLVLTERKTRYEYIELIDGKKAKDVSKGLERLVKRIGKKETKRMKTVTVDNGTEFLDYESIEKILGVDVYYCHPYASYERGSNENHNKLIRRFLPKGMAFTNVTKKYVQKIEDWMNNYPRVTKSYTTPNQLRKIEAI